MDIGPVLFVSKRDIFFLTFEFYRHPHIRNWHRCGVLSNSLHPWADLIFAFPEDRMPRGKGETDCLEDCLFVPSCWTVSISCWLVPTEALFWKTSIPKIALLLASLIISAANDIR